MSEEPTLRELIELRFDHQEEISKERWEAHRRETAADAAATEEARKRADEELKAWRATHNNLIGAMREKDETARLELKDLLAQFATKAEVEALERTMDRRGGLGEGIRLSFGAMAGTLTAVLAFVGLVAFIADKLAS